MDRSTSGSRGAILIEFAMVVPLLLMCGLFCLEGSNLLSKDQYAAILSRQLASTALRQCLSQAVSDNEGTGVRACLKQNVPGKINRVKELFQFAESIAPGTELLISVYINQTPDSATAYYTKATMLQSLRVGNTVEIGDPFQRGGAYTYETKFFLSANAKGYGNNGKTAYTLDPSVPIDRDLAGKQKVLFIAEAYVKHTLIAQLANFFFGKKDARYDVTIF